MGDSEESLTHALIRLASAQDRMAADLAEVADQMKTMNGSIRDHNTRLALDAQWAQNHTGPNSIHEMIEKRLVINEKLARVGIAIPTIMVIGGAIAAIVAAVR